MALALSHANDFSTFAANYLKIAYGGAHDSSISFYNRNHFVEVDLNPINRNNGWFKDITSRGKLAAFAKTISAVIDKQHWFAKTGFQVQFS